MDVVLLRWPEESIRRTELEMVARPRLLLVEPGEPPPDCSDPLEDWIRMPADDRDVRARLRALVERAGVERPQLDDDGLLWFRGRWVSLSPVERALVEGLLERFGAVTGRDSLRRRAWPEGLPSRNALDVHMVRLRRRIRELSLEIRTVRSRGYLLQAVEPSA
jgi:DNA-binding response OmpR family regulator